MVYLDTVPPKSGGTTIWPTSPQQLWDTLDSEHNCGFNPVRPLAGTTFERTFRSLFWGRILLFLTHIRQHLAQNAEYSSRFQHILDTVEPVEFVGGVGGAPHLSLHFSGTISLPSFCLRCAHRSCHQLLWLLMMV